jgi:hypothetical protein
MASTVRGSRNPRARPKEGCAELVAPGLPAAVQSRHADWSMSTNASPSGLSEPWAPMLFGSTTGCNQPSEVKCDIPANGDGDGDEEAEAEEEEDCAVLVVVSDADGEKVAAAVPFVVKSAARVISACEINFVLPVRIARR